MLAISHKLHSQKGYIVALEQTYKPKYQKAVRGMVVAGGLATLALGLVAASVVHYQIARKLKGMGSAVQALTPMLFGVIPIFPVGMAASLVGAGATIYQLRGDISAWRDSARFHRFALLSEDDSKVDAWVIKAQARVDASGYRPSMFNLWQGSQKQSSWVNDEIIDEVRSNSGPFVDVVANEATRVLAEIGEVTNVLAPIRRSLDADHGDGLTGRQKAAHIAIYRAHLMFEADRLISAWEGFRAAPHSEAAYDTLMVARNKVQTARYAGIRDAVLNGPHKKAADHYKDAQPEGEQWEPASVREYSGDAGGHRRDTVWTKGMNPDYLATWVR